MDRIQSSRSRQLFTAKELAIVRIATYQKVTAFKPKCDGCIAMDTSHLNISPTGGSVTHFVDWHVAAAVVGLVLAGF